MLSDGITAESDLLHCVSIDELTEDEMLEEVPRDITPFGRMQIKRMYAAANPSSPAALPSDITLFSCANREHGDVFVAYLASVKSLPCAHDRGRTNERHEHWLYATADNQSLAQLESGSVMIREMFVKMQERGMWEMRKVNGAITEASRLPARKQVEHLLPPDELIINAATVRVDGISSIAAKACQEIERTIIEVRNEWALGAVRSYSAQYE